MIELFRVGGSALAVRSGGRLEFPRTRLQAIGNTPKIWGEE